MSTPLVQLPREMVMASAGTGKTFRISSRIIGLLALGVEPETIFASSFTRKAAGEILDRVLSRLAGAALDDARAATLSQQVSFPDGPPFVLGPAEWLAVLDRLLRSLHRLSIGTIDSFFVRTALSFAAEIELPPVWTVADPAALEGIRSEALADVIASPDTGAVLELVRGIARGDSARAVHDTLIRDAEDLLRLHHSIDPESPDAWHRLDAAVDAEPDDSLRLRADLAARLRAAPLPTSRSTGLPDNRWAAAVDKAALQIERGEWLDLMEGTLCSAARDEGGTFYSQPVPGEICDVIAEAMRLVRAVLGRRYATQARALGRLARLLDEAVSRRQRERGAYDFGDVTRLIGGVDPISRRADLYYRLDARTQHILLDEFQDTSVMQWEALEPLVDELLSGYEGERAAVLVADPKQSIYAWRGGEPALPGYVGGRYGLEEEVFNVSRRSSQTVLDAVNIVFSRLAENPVFEDRPEAAEVARDWAPAFPEHIAFHEARPGFVRMEVGPADEGQGSDRPNLCRRTAELIADLRTKTPDFTIGVLTRRNQTVGRIMLELRDLDIAASGEGGTPLTDSAATASVLALLRLAEHPADTVARYHVARTPIGEALGLVDPRDAGGATRLALDIRRRLIEDGYGATLEWIARKIAGSSSGREKRRLGQLAETGFLFDSRSSLRISDFLRYVDRERVQDPTESDVRVMTIHQAKGLEFDIVVLPELDATLARTDPQLLAYRPDPVGRVRYAFPYIPEKVRDLFPDVPELAGAAEQASAGNLRDGLSGLYVALTRPKHALHILVKPDGKKGMGSGLTGACLLRHAFGATDPAVEGAVLFEDGDAGWAIGARRQRETERPASKPLPPVPESVALRTGARTRVFPRRNPSDMAGDSRVDLRLVLNLESAAASEGTLVHAWLEAMEWLDDGFPHEAELLKIARRIQPDIGPDRVAELARKVKRSLEAPAVRGALVRASYPEGSLVEREMPFLFREPEALVEGVIDRVVIETRDGAPVAATILDYKTDAIADPSLMAKKTLHYAAQMAAYRKAVAAGFRVPEANVRSRLIFLDAGEVRDVG